MLVRSPSRRLLFAAALLGLAACHGSEQPVGAGQLYQQPVSQRYEREETRTLVALVDDAAQLVRTKGEAAFDTLRVQGSRWRRGEWNVLVVDTEGDLVVHPDKTMEGRNGLALRDVGGKPIIRGLLATATSVPGRTDGWYHYEWPVPGELLPRWRSTYVRLVQAPSGKRYVVASGMVDDRMEKSFVVDLVNDAAGEIAKDPRAAFAKLRDPKDRFVAKDAYVFVLDPRGVDLVDPAMPRLEGKSLLDTKDTRGKQPIREMLDVARMQGSGWVEYMWPKPGESVSTMKSAFVKRVDAGPEWFLVGCGVYLADAPRGGPVATITAPELAAFVREAAALVEKRGDAAYAELSEKGSKWSRDDARVFVWAMDGTCVLHPADRAREGTNGSGAQDVLGRPYGKEILERASSPAGEGWVHSMDPPDGMFPAWKSTFLKRVTLPSGAQRIVGSGVYGMKMDEAFVRDVVDRAAALVAQKGKAAFAELRDPRGPYVFMSTYVFVDSPEGIELVNGGQPSLEGKDVLPLRDAKGKRPAREAIAKAMKDGGGWVDSTWYRPGQNRPAPKRAFVKRVRGPDGVYVVGSGMYVE
jgi:signal transduction histidine kinase